MKVSSFFQGSALRFSVTGTGVSHDPATGDLTIDTEALAAGITVTVAALDAAGAPGQSFQLTLAAAPSAGEAIPPSLVTPPALAGSGRLGEALTVDPGTWEGVPAPTLSLQWLRDGAEIDGATEAVYVPGDEDDGRALTCRVTAQNAAGLLAAEPEPLRITRTPPLAVDLIGDVSVLEGSAAVEIDAAAAFSGTGLAFSVAGAGAVIDAATGLVTLPTDTVQDGTLVTVTAGNSGGTAEASFLVSILLRPFPPLLLAVPALAGTGKIGSAVTVDAGSWSGLPAPALSLQWLRDGAEIAGATAAAYVPTDADDRCALACRVTALNAAGSLAAETAPLAVTQEAPTLVGELLDEVFDLGTGPETIATAQVFEGRGLAFGASGAGATIDPATGVLTLPTDAVRSGEAVTVTATNSGGAASASFQVTVEDPAVTVPAAIADGLWSASEVRDAAPAGRRQISIDASVVVPTGFELRLYSGPQAGGAIAATNRVMTPGQTYTTSSSMAVGTTCYNCLYWRRTADDQWTLASGEKAFSIDGLSTATPPVIGFPAANQTLAAATSAALVAALQARIATGSTAEWVIDLPSGDYGNLAIDDFKLPGRTILRSANYPATGAKFRSVGAQRAKNVQFQFCSFDRTGLGYIATMIRFQGSSGCGISYSDLNFNMTKTPNAGTKGWVQNVGTGVHLWRDDDTQTTTTDFTFYMNYLHGVADCAVWVASCSNSTFAENVFADIGGDDFQFGNSVNVKFINNWGSRRKYPAWSGTDYKHTDFIQCDSRYVYSENVEFTGNVLMKGVWEGLTEIPSQGLFSSKSFTRNWSYENNVIVTNTPNAICVGASTAGNAEGHRAWYNTTLRLIDDFSFANQHDARVAVAGGVSIDRNVMCGISGATGMGVNGLNIVMKAGTKDYTASRAWYVNAVMEASFYDIRPVEGKATHWAFGGEKLGAYQRFQDVIVGGKYPKIGPAAAGWKAAYDPKNQITS